MTRTWQDNAREFGALTRQGKDVRLALLVACSVVKGRGGPRTVANATVKVSAREFGEYALGSGDAAKRVLRHLDAWDRMAELAAVPTSSTLTPADAETFGEVSEEVQEQFAIAFSSITAEKPTGGRPRDSRPEDAAKIIEQRGTKAVAEAMTDAQKTAMREHLQREHVDAYKAEHPTPPGTPEGKASAAALLAANDASRNIAEKVHMAAVLLQEAQRNWEIDYPGLVPRERAEVESSLREIEVLAGSLRMNISVGG